MCQDGSIRYDKPTLAYLSGSTWGGSMLRMGWIGHQMHMEVVFKKEKLVTTNVKNVEVTSSDESWSYSMDWGEGDE